MRTWIVALLIIYSTAAHAAHSSVKKKTESTRVSGQIQQIQKNIIVDQQQQQLIEQELQKTEIAIGELSQQISKFNTAIEQEQQMLTKLKGNQRTAINKLAQENAGLGQQIRAIYQLGQSHYLKVVVNQEDPNTIQRYLTYHGYLTKARLKLILDIKKTLISLKHVMGSIAVSQQNLKLLLTQKEMEQAEQELAQKHRQILLDDLHQNVQSNQQRLSTLVTNRKTLQDIISHLKEQTQMNSVIPAQAGINPEMDSRLRGNDRISLHGNDSTVSNLSFESSQGKLSWPVKGKIAAHFGSTLDVGTEHLSGIIIKAPLGTAVHSIYPGKVIFANWLRGFGLLIIVDHGNDYMSLYGRNRALYAKVGDHVKTGDIIATTGNSGGFDKASLYFEIRKNGSPLNPNSWCR